MKNKKLLLLLSSSTFMLWTGYSMAACTTNEEAQAEASMARQSLYSIPDEMGAKYQVLIDKAFDLLLDDDYAGACELYGQVIQEVKKLQDSGKVCTSEQVLERTDVIFNIASQLNQLPAAQVAKFRARIDQAGKLIRDDKRVEGCALYDEIIKDAAALGIKPSN